MMKIAEARRAYATQLSVQRGQRAQLLKQKEKLEQEKANRLSVSSETSGNGVSLELSDEYLQRFTELQERIDTLTDQIKKNEKSLDDVIEMEVGIANSEVAKQQGDAMEEAAEDMAKCLEIARRISRGDKVPAQDEKKLMDFNMEIYQIAKNMAVMNMNKKHKEWESLWEDEEEKQEYADPMETAADAEMNIAMPEGMDATAQSQEFRE
ncbi:MAG: hypothetical protein PUF03_02420 [Lachnospiraceae bacterium]|nr:hypothetical protein [Lachnospiraceae bacterium]MDD6627088.1 hypothetical protein [Lachnospiraceae bacterium]